MDVERLTHDLDALREYCDVTQSSAGAEVCREAAAALAKLEAERDEAITNSQRTFENAVAWQERAEKAEAERDEAQAALEVCRESLVDQAAARADPAMPLLVASVRERLEDESEAVYAMSENRDDRIYAHGLSLLSDWQKAAASRAMGDGE